ncbi:unnamed protein product [marine sediment metagenome]|uniref:Uncharacterized protein n=1 Tax=marine sediment metagenome TaxID=412755 RepID=X1BKD9_9ZZZZ
MKQKAELSESYCITFNRREQRYQLNVKGIWLHGVRQLNTLQWNNWKDELKIEDKLYFIS